MPPLGDMGPPLLPASAVKRASASSDPSTTSLEHRKENDQLSSKPDTIEQACPSPTTGQKRTHDEVSQPAASLLEQFPILGESPNEPMIHWELPTEFKQYEQQPLSLQSEESLMELIEKSRIMSSSVLKGVSLASLTGELAHQGRELSSLDLAKRDMSGYEAQLCDAWRNGATLPDLDSFSGGHQGSYTPVRRSILSSTTFEPDEESKLYALSDLYHLDVKAGELLTFEHLRRFETAFPQLRPLITAHCRVLAIETGRNMNAGLLNERYRAEMSALRKNIVMIESQLSDMISSVSRGFQMIEGNCDVLRARLERLTFGDVDAAAHRGSFLPSSTHWQHTDRQDSVTEQGDHPSPAYETADEDHQTQGRYKRHKSIEGHPGAIDFLDDDKLDDAAREQGQGHEDNVADEVVKGDAVPIESGVADPEKIHSKIDAPEQTSDKSVAALQEDDPDVSSERNSSAEQQRQEQVEAESQSLASQVVADAQEAHDVEAEEKALPPIGQAMSAPAALSSTTSSVSAAEPIDDGEHTNDADLPESQRTISTSDLVRRGATALADYEAQLANQLSTGGPFATIPFKPAELSRQLPESESIELDTQEPSQSQGSIASQQHGSHVEAANAQESQALVAVTASMAMTTDKSFSATSLFGQRAMQQAAVQDESSPSTSLGSDDGSSKPNPIIAQKRSGGPQSFFNRLKGGNKD